MATANAVLDKGTMREVWKVAGIEQPAFQIILKEDEIEDFGRSIGYPLVIKPVDCGGGGRGVMVINSSADIPQAYSFASRFLHRNPRLIIEEFIDGIESSVEVIRFGGVTHIVAFSDKVKAPYSSRVATEISYPGFFSKTVVEKIRCNADRIMRSLGLHEGVGHIEFIVTKDEQAFVLEIGARAGGGHTLHPIASYVSGLNYPQWLSKFYLGAAEPPKIKTYKGACYAFYHADASGTLRDIAGLDKAREIPNIHCVEVWKQPGSHVSILENSMERLGCIVALAETRDDANRAALQARQQIELHITPDALRQELPSNMRNNTETLLISQLKDRHQNGELCNGNYPSVPLSPCATIALREFIDVNLCRQRTCAIDKLSAFAFFIEDIKCAKNTVNGTRHLYLATVSKFKSRRTRYVSSIGKPCQGID